MTPALVHYDHDTGQVVVSVHGAEGVGLVHLLTFDVDITEEERFALRHLLETPPAAPDPD